MIRPEKSNTFLMRYSYLLAAAFIFVLLLPNAHKAGFIWGWGRPLLVSPETLTEQFLI